MTKHFCLIDAQMTSPDKRAVTFPNNWLLPAIIALCLSVTCSLSGCRNRQAVDADSKAANEVVPTIASAEQTVATEVELASAGARGHPIDSLPQGRRYRAAVRAIDQGDLSSAERIRTELNADAHYNSLATAITAMLLIKQDKLNDALHLAEEISAIPVMQAEAYVIAGEIFQRQNRLSEASVAFEKAIEIDPQHSRAHRWLGIVYYDTGAMRLATNHLRLATQFEPAEPNSLLLSAKIFQEYEQYAEAIEDYVQLLKRVQSPKMEAQVRVKLAECYLALRKLPEARETLVGCPPAPQVLAIKASIAESDGDSGAAVSLARNAIEQSPSNRTAGMVLGRIYSSERRWQDALNVLENLVRESPYDHEPRMLLGRALIGAGEVAQGKSEVKAATQLKDSFLKFADLHQEAIKHPYDAKVRVELGNLARQLGKQRLAKSWYLSAIGLDPTHEGARQALGELVD